MDQVDGLLGLSFMLDLQPQNGEATGLLELENLQILCSFQYVKGISISVPLVR
jgi:hypothetical protein